MAAAPRRAVAARMPGAVVLALAAALCGASEEICPQPPESHPENSASLLQSNSVQVKVAAFEGQEEEEERRLAESVGEVAGKAVAAATTAADGLHATRGTASEQPTAGDSKAGASATPAQAKSHVAQDSPATADGKVVAAAAELHAAAATGADAAAEMRTKQSGPAVVEQQVSNASSSAVAGTGAAREPSAARSGPAAVEHRAAGDARPAAAPTHAAAELPGARGDPPASGRHVAPDRKIAVAATAAEQHPAAAGDAVAGATVAAERRSALAGQPVGEQHAADAGGAAAPARPGAAAAGEAASGASTVAPGNATAGDPVLAAPRAVEAKPLATPQAEPQVPAKERDDLLDGVAMSNFVGHERGGRRHHPHHSATTKTGEREAPQSGNVASGGLAVAAGPAAGTGVAEDSAAKKGRVWRVHHAAVRLLSKAAKRLCDAATGQTRMGYIPMSLLILLGLVCLILMCLEFIGVLPRLFPGMGRQRSSEADAFIAAARPAPSTKAAMQPSELQGPGSKRLAAAAEAAQVAMAVAGHPPGQSSTPGVSAVSLGSGSQIEPEIGSYLCPGLVVPEQCEVTLRVPRLQPTSAMSEATIDDTARVPVFKVIYSLPSRADASLAAHGADQPGGRCLALSSSGADRTVFAFCRPGLGGALTVFDVAEKPFGLVRARVGRGGYEVATRGGAQISIAGAQDAEYVFTDRKNRTLALTEAIRGDANHRMLRVGPFVDAGLMTLAILAADLIESMPA